MSDPAAPPGVRAAPDRLRSAPTLFAIATLIWGSTWLAITFQLGVVAAEISVAYRFALAALILAVWCRATGRSLAFSRRDHAFLVAQGVLMFGANYVAIYEAERYLTSGLVAVLFSTIVFTNPMVRNHHARVGVLEGTVWGMAWGAATAALIATVTGAPWA